MSPVKQIVITLQQPATIARLTVNPEVGHWVLPDDADIDKDQLVQVDSAKGYIGYSLTQDSVALELGPASKAETAVVIAYFKPKPGKEYFDGELCRPRRDTRGRVDVHSPDGKETDSLLPGQCCRRVTLRLDKPGHGGDDCD